MPARVIMPQLGESVVEGTVTRWLKQVGERVDELEALLEVNTDKVDTEIPSPASGVVLEILVPENTTVKAGTLLAWIGKPGESVPQGETNISERDVNILQVEGQSQETPDKPIESDLEATQVAGTSSADTPFTQSRDTGFISPVVAKLAAEHQVDLSQVPGTGDGGRITKKDVLAYLESGSAVTEKAAWETPGSGDLFKPTELMGMQTPPAASAAKPDREVEAAKNIVQLPLIRRQIAAKMVESMQQVPHVTTVMEADLQNVVLHREANKAVFERSHTRLTFSAYFFIAAAQALKVHPMVNTSWGEQGILLHPQVNLGMAVSLGDAGLIVPVIHNADRLSLSGMALSIQDLAERARSQKLKPEEVLGSTFSITNHGTGGSLFATPVINPPNCAILGVGSIQKRVVVIQDAIAIRPMVYLTLTFDHRILDGATADAFLAEVVSRLETWSSH